MEGKKYRLVTRSDFDGLVCAVLLREKGLIDDILFVHPKDMQDGKIEITDNDITANLPYVKGAHLVFDHHESELVRVGSEHDNHVINENAPSAARVVYEYYGGEKGFPGIPKAMMDAVDKGDSANFTEEEVLRPTGWNLLNFIMDARTGLGRFRDFRISNYQLMMDLIVYVRQMDIEEILALPDVQERAALYAKYEQAFKEQLKRCSCLHGKVAVLDLRCEEIIYPGNRFILYTLYPEANISIHVIWGRDKQNTVFAVGKSIFNRTSTLNIGDMLLLYGGGGHPAAGTCQIPNENAQNVFNELLIQLNR